MRLLISLHFIFSTFFAFAQNEIKEPWSLSNCLDTAFVNNVELKGIDLNVLKTKLIKDNSYNNYLPYINGGVNHGYNWGRKVDAYTNEFITKRTQYNNFFISGSLNLFNGFQNKYKQKINEIDFISARYNKVIKKRNFEIDLTTLYFQVLLNKSLVDLADSNLFLAISQKERIEQLVEVGNEPIRKTYEILTSVEQAKYLVLKSKNDLDYSLLLLQQLLNVNYSKEFDIQSININGEEEISKELKLASFPEIKNANSVIERQEFNIKNIKSELYPSLSLNGSIGTGYSENNKILGSDFQLVPKKFNNQLNENLYQSAFLTLTIPIYNQNIVRTQVKFEEIELEENILYKEKLKLEVDQKVNLLLLDFQNSKAETNALNNSVKLYTKTYINAELEYRNGLITYYQLQEISNLLYRSRSNFIQSRYKTILNKMIYDIYIKSSN